MPSARRRIAIITTTLILGALPAMVPAALAFLGATGDPGIAAGALAVASWVIIGAALLMMLTPLFTDMRLGIRSALRVSALGLAAGIVIGWPMAMVLHPTAGIIIGLIAGTGVAQRDLGRQLGAVDAALRDDLRAAARWITARARRRHAAVHTPGDTDRAPVISPGNAPVEIPVAPLIDDGEIGRRRGDG